MQYDQHTRTWRGSATDLANHARCEHLTQRTRAREQAIVEGREERPAPADDLAVRKGREFEDAWVAARRVEVEAAGGRVLDLSDADPRTRRAQLEQALRDGIELIVQAPMPSGALSGYADALERDEDADAPAGRLATRHRYRPVELKFARTVKVEHVLQVAAYADALVDLQGELPRTMVVITGDGERHEHDPRDYVDYVRGARGRFTDALALELDEQLAVVPEPVPHCERCDFRECCAGRRVEVDHLSLVARIRADQRTRLRAVGVDTLAGLAALDDEARVTGISAGALRQLRAQARLQLEARSTSLPPIEFRRPDEHELSRRGFALLPEPDRRDLFFDFEGYPFHEAGGLEYLWGWTHLRADGSPDFDFEWADTLEAEDAAFERFVAEVEHRRALSPGMHVYHYAPYEVTALNRIARRRPEWMRRIDALLRAGVFVDLFAVVRQAMLVGVDSYSIKRLERLYAGDLREGAELADGGASIEEYEQWLLTADTTIRDRIIAYNRDDCDSTLQLRDWLLERRDDAARAGIEWPAPPEPDDADDEEAATPEPHEAELLRARLAAVADDDARGEDVRAAARLLAAMPGWGWRIKREFLGDLYGRRHDRDDADYVAEPQAIGALELLEVDESPRRAGEGTVDRTYRYPDQVTLVKVDDHAPDAYDGHTALKVGCIRAIDQDERTVTIRTSAKQQAYVDHRLVDAGESPGRIPTSIIGYADIPHAMLEAAAIRVARSLLEALDAGNDPFHPERPHAAALALLARHAPRVADGAGPEALHDPPPPDELADLVDRLAGSHVVVQGPPGTGKTWTSARLLVELVSRGLRVGISSNSHEAVVNLLEELDELRDESAAAGRAFPVRAAYAPKRTLGLGDWLTAARTNRAAREAIAAGDANVLAGTAWTFADADLRLDAVLIDEAGQVSLLHGTAIASCTSRVVLVGDPQQLPQPSSVSHPHGCDASVLGHLFGEEAVLEPARAALLSQTRRMHPSITEFVSDSYYEGRLQSHADTALQRVRVPRRPQLPAAGIALLDVEHVGNRIRSDEEADAIAALVDDLLGGGMVVPRPRQPERALTVDDLIVVAPYNAQRRLLQERLPAGVRIGTVDKFQGKEAPVAIVSMTASSRDELPRGLEFLLDPHRLNVAISRARALAVLVASPSLRATAAEDPHEMRLLNDLARFARLATAA